MRPLFSDAPVMPRAQVMPAQMPYSALAAALSGQHAPFTLPAPSMQIPLSALAGLKPDPNAGVTSSTPNLAWNPNNPVGTDTLGGNTANQGSWAGNAAAAYLPGYQGAAGQAPATATPGQVSAGMPGQIPAGGYQPTGSDQPYIDAMRQSGALAPQYQAPPPPPQPSWLDQLMARVNGTRPPPPPGVATPGAPGPGGLAAAMTQPPPSPY